MSGTMEFITITSGGTVMSPRKEVSDGVIAYVRHALETDGYLMDDWSVDVIGKTPGTAVFVMALSRLQGTTRRKVGMTRCMVCWATDESDSAWEAVADEAPASVVLHRPRGVPWLAVVLTAGAVEVAAAGGAGLLMELADMERCVAWTLIESAQP